VQVSTNHGLTWTDVSSGIPNRWVTRVAPDPFDSQTIYATLSGFRWDEPLPHVYKSTNLGQTWTAIWGNLSGFPVNDIVLDPDIPDKIIVATDAGLYCSDDGGATWSWVWSDLPAVPTYALKIHVPTRTLVAGTYGLSTYSADLDDIVVGVSDIKHRTESRLTVNPNPVTTNSSLQFFLPKPDHLTCSIRCMDGKTSGTGSKNIGNLERGNHAIRLGDMIDVNQMPAGIYLVALEGDRSRISGKIVVL